VDIAARLKVTLKDLKPRWLNRITEQLLGANAAVPGELEASLNLGLPVLYWAPEPIHNHIIEQSTDGLYRWIESWPERGAWPLHTLRLCQGASTANQRV
jgi:hypothetical protein